MGDAKPSLLSQLYANENQQPNQTLNTLAGSGLMCEVLVFAYSGKPPHLLKLHRSDFGGQCWGDQCRLRCLWGFRPRLWRLGLNH